MPAKGRGRGAAKSSAAKKKVKSAAPAAQCALQQARAKYLAGQAIRESIHFKGMSHTAIHSTEVDSETLFGLIYKHKLAELRGEPHPSFGPNFYRGVAARYKSSGCEHDALTPSTGGLQVRECMIIALCRWTDVDKSTGPIIEWMSLTKEVLCLLLLVDSR